MHTGLHVHATAILEYTTANHLKIVPLKPSIDYYISNQNEITRKIKKLIS